MTTTTTATATRAKRERAKTHPAGEQLLTSLRQAMDALEVLQAVHDGCQEGDCGVCLDVVPVCLLVQLFEGFADGRTVLLCDDRPDWRPLVPAGTSAPNHPALVAAAFGLLRAAAAAEQLRDTEGEGRGLVRDAANLTYWLRLSHEILWNGLTIDDVLTAEKRRLLSGRRPGARWV